MLKVLITGGEGLLAHALKTLNAPSAELVLLGHQDFDLTNKERMAEQLAILRPDVVINTAAYNLVDHCEIERELSWAVNSAGPENLAVLCAEHSCRLVHFGTDYVFDGESLRPYIETDAPNPLNHYGAGKLAGEQAVLRASPDHLVLRTSWLFGDHPTQTKTYIHSVLRAAGGGKALKAAHDQYSVPTYAPDLAQWTLSLVERRAHGLFHAVNDEGVSRYDWTRAILEEARHAGRLQQIPEVEPVPTGYFNPTMRRPAYTVLSNEKAAGCLGKPLGSWRAGLRAWLGNGLVLRKMLAAGQPSR